MYLRVCSFQFPGLALFLSVLLFASFLVLGLIRIFCHADLTFPLDASRRCSSWLTTLRLLSSRLVSSRLILSFSLLFYEDAILPTDDHAFTVYREQSVRRSRFEETRRLSFLLISPKRRGEVKLKLKGEEKRREKRRKREARFRRRRRRSVSNTPRLLAGEAAWHGMAWRGVA